MGGTLILKKERNKYRYMLEDEKGNAVMRGAFIGEKDKAEFYMKMISESETLENNLAPMQGPDGKWVFKGFYHAVGEGARDTNVTDAVPLGFSVESYATEAEMEKARKAAIEAAKGCAIKDES